MPARRPRRGSRGQEGGGGCKNEKRQERRTALLTCSNAPGPRGPARWPAGPLRYRARGDIPGKVVFFLAVLHSHCHGTALTAAHRAHSKDRTLLAAGWTALRPVGLSGHSVPKPVQVQSAHQRSPPHKRSPLVSRGVGVAGTALVCPPRRSPLDCGPRPVAPRGHGGHGGAEQAEGSTSPLPPPSRASALASLASLASRRPGGGAGGGAEGRLLAPGWRRRRAGRATRGPHWLYLQAPRPASPARPCEAPRAPGGRAGRGTTGLRVEARIAARPGRELRAARHALRTASPVGAHAAPLVGQVEK